MQKTIEVLGARDLGELMNKSLWLIHLINSLTALDWSFNYLYRGNFEHTEQDLFSAF